MFGVVIAIEAAALSRESRPSAGYVKNDTRASIHIGAVSLAFLLFFKVVTLLLFSFVWAEWAPWHLPTDSWLTWLVLFVAVDLAWYCNHRFSHRVRIGWAGHKAHHSSETFNFSTAVRLKWNPWTEAIFWLPLPLLGFAPWTIYVAYGFNMIYQFFLHTELVGTLARPVEFVFNTPAHHRIHHSRRPEHLDKNYGGILIVWDRIFGTLVDGNCYPEYGLYEKTASEGGILQLQYGEYGRILTDVRHAHTWRHRLAHVFAPPGWRPEAPLTSR
ncbi:sterol desaturase family protein [Mycobacterium sp. AT1]|uniref:sterol desaturase family protein n=1 Tax=Mycobacterium sp. AT1 TaxID=1961706 RepID=UPI001E5FD2E2|nr:sterol desaturase family protein [Mycobacterium sp. AT1]